MIRNYAFVGVTLLAMAGPVQAAGESCAATRTGLELCYDGPLPHKIVKTAAGFHVTVGDMHDKLIGGTKWPNSKWEDLPPETILEEYLNVQKKLAKNTASYRFVSYGQSVTGQYSSAVSVLLPKRRWFGLLPPFDYLRPVVVSHTYVDGQIFYLSSKANADAKAEDIVAQRRQILAMLRKTSKEN